jgi:hypothetical protein
MQYGVLMVDCSTNWKNWYQHVLIMNKDRLTKNTMQYKSKGRRAISKEKMGTTNCGDVTDVN